MAPTRTPAPVLALVLAVPGREGTETSWTPLHSFSVTKMQVFLNFFFHEKFIGKLKNKIS